MWKKIVALVLLTSVMAGCSLHAAGSPGATGFPDPYCIISVDVPYADNTYFSRWDKVELLDEDEWGRRYFSYQTYSVMLGKKIEIHVICQQSTVQEEYFYYPDDCYIIREQESDCFSDAAISDLKYRNDWGKPLCKEKMSSIMREVCNEEVVFENEFQDEIRKHLNLSESYVVLHNSLERFSETEQLYYAWIAERDDKGELVNEPMYFLVIYDVACENPIKLCQQATGLLDCQDEVRAFRATWLNVTGDGIT